MVQFRTARPRHALCSNLMPFIRLRSVCALQTNIDIIQMGLEAYLCWDFRVTRAGGNSPLVYGVTHCSFIYKLPGFETETQRKPTSASLSLSPSTSYCLCHCHSWLENRANILQNVCVLGVLAPCQERFRPRLILAGEPQISLFPSEQVRGLGFEKVPLKRWSLRPSVWAVGRATHRGSSPEMTIGHASEGVRKWAVPRNAVCSRGAGPSERDVIIFRVFLYCKKWGWLNIRV